MFKLLTTLGAAAAMMTAATPQPELRGAALMEALHGGGYTIVLRHARTDRSFQEDVGAVPTSRAQQRNLNDDGVRDARLMGVVFKKYDIPFGDVIASPMFRATETAEYAVRQARTTMVLRTFPTLDDARALIAESPAKGTNRLLVTHHFVIETHVPGIKQGAIGESEAVVVRTAPDGTIEVVGRILLADWTALAAGASSTSAATPQGHSAPAVYTATHTAESVNFPDTPVARLAQGYVRAFSTGDTAVMRQFIESSVDADPARSMADRLTSYAKLYGDVGQLHIASIDSVAAHEITVTTHAARRTVRITLKDSEKQVGRASSITLRVEDQ
jgi:phosphohistidine phosphatase SixA